MNHRSLFTNLRYRGRFQSLRRSYHVLEGVGHYILFSPKSDGAGGNYSVVPKAAIDYVTKRLGGTKSIKTADGLTACKRSKYFPNRFSFLNAMYVLLATKQGRISKVQGQTLFFGIRKGPA
jgi:hypothetical protein